LSSVKELVPTSEVTIVAPPAKTTVRRRKTTMTRRERSTIHSSTRSM
jgi:hypothetical protein